VALLNWAGIALGGLPAPWIALLDALSNFSAVFLGIFVEAAPFLLLGTLASSLVETFISREDLARWMPRNPLLGALAGGLFGLFFPVCECGVVPFGRRLLRKGVPLPAVIATLLAAPVVNPIVIASTLAAFGPGTIFWGRLALSLSIAVLTGAVFSLANPRDLLRDEALGTPLEAMPPPILTDVTPEVGEIPLARRLQEMLVLTADEFFEMGRYLILGALLAAFMQTVVPQSSLLAVGQGPFLSVVALVLVAVLLSVCSTVDAFIALAFAGAFAPGAVLAFLVFGPMVDIKSTLMYLRVFKPRAVIYLILLPLLLTLLSGTLLNRLLGGLP
jgi:uncharacterized membrane protein YraQ (UPF0718 family)